MFPGAVRAVVAVGAVRVHRAGRGRADADHAGDAAHASARHHQGGRAARATARRLLPRAPRAHRQTERHADDVTVLAPHLPASVKDIMMLHLQLCRLTIARSIILLRSGSVNAYSGYVSLLRFLCTGISMCDINSYS